MSRFAERLCAENENNSKFALVPTSTMWSCVDLTDRTAIFGVHDLLLRTRFVAYGPTCVARPCASIYLKSRIN
jgi:hypothetical protein